MRTNMIVSLERMKSNIELTIQVIFHRSFDRANLVGTVETTVVHITIVSRPICDNLVK
jgi:hypothetical protein